jgi:hypothetical protein
MIIKRIIAKINNKIKQKLARYIYSEINNLIAIDIREAFKNHA